jgi:hypothetical protein
MMGTLWLPAGCKPLPGQRVQWEKMGLPRPVGCWWLNEGSGALVNDASGNGNHGTLTNMDPATDWVGTPYGTAMDFDGSNDVVNVPDSPSLRPASAQGVTLYARAMTRSIFEGWRAFIRKEFVLSESWALDGIGDCLRFIIRGTGGYSLCEPSGTLVAGQWFSAAGTWNSSSGAVLYKDGSVVATDPYVSISSIQYDNSVVTIGRQVAAVKSLDGQVGVAIIWPVALTASQVRALQGPVPIWVPQRYVSLGGATVTATRRFNPGLWTPGTNPGVM